MPKEFEKWNEIKIILHDKEVRKLYHVREVWWCALGFNIGFEQNGDGENYQRPVLILKGLSGNTCLIAPLTSSLHKHPMRIPIGRIANKEASALISQIRVIDTKRLINKVCFIDKSIFENLKKIVKNMF